MHNRLGDWGRLRVDAFAPRFRHDSGVLLPVGLDDIVFRMSELCMEVAVDRMEDVRYPDRTSFVNVDWFPVPFYALLVEEAKLDA